MICENYRNKRVFKNAKRVFKNANRVFQESLPIVWNYVRMYSNTQLLAF
jgi:hypothetical protein